MTIEPRKTRKYRGRVMPRGTGTGSQSCSIPPHGLEPLPTEPLLQEQHTT